MEGRLIHSHYAPPNSFLRKPCLDHSPPKMKESVDSFLEVSLAEPTSDLFLGSARF